MLLAGVAGSAILLVGCTTPSGPAGTPTHTATAAPKLTTTPAPKASDVLFTIAANVRAVDGSTIGILLTAHTPVAHSDPAPNAYESTFLSHCGAGKGGLARDATSLSANGSILLPVDITASNPGKTFVSPVSISLGSPYFGATATGKTLVPTDTSAPCYSGYEWVTSGPVHGIADFESGKSSPNLTLWRYGLYGFGVAQGSNATIEACTITITPLGAADDVASVAGWDTSTPQSGLACVIGYIGE